MYEIYVYVCLVYVCEYKKIVQKINIGAHLDVSIKLFAKLSFQTTDFQLSTLRD